MANLTWAIATIKKCFVAPNTINPKILNDELAFSIAMTKITMALDSGEITVEEFEKQIIGEGVIQ